MTEAIDLTLEMVLIVLKQNQFNESSNKTFLILNCHHGHRKYLFLIGCISEHQRNTVQVLNQTV